MRFKEAFALNQIEPLVGTRRLVFTMPGENFLVVKFFGEGTQKGTVKLWSGELDYERTIRSWRTSKPYKPTQGEINAAMKFANDLILECGYYQHALVNRQSGGPWGAR